MSKIDYCKDILDKKILNSIDDFSINILNQKELEKFFNKYNIIELEVFDSIFEYVKSFDLTNVKKWQIKFMMKKMKF